MGYFYGEEQITFTPAGSVAPLIDITLAFIWTPSQQKGRIAEIFEGELTISMQDWQIMKRPSKQTHPTAQSMIFRGVKYDLAEDCCFNTSTLSLEGDKHLL